jgi:hypothetical protein
MEVVYQCSAMAVAVSDSHWQNTAAAAPLRVCHAYLTTRLYHGCGCHQQHFLLLAATHALPSAACVSSGGRYLQDLWVYNLNRLQWTAPAASAEQQQDAAEGGEEEGAALLAPAGPPASAGWSVTPFQDKLLVLGGHVKVGKVCMDHVAWFTVL